MRRAALVSFVSLITLGCGRSPNTVQQAQLKPDSIGYSRFQLVSSTAYGIALDTKTGELCHTYNEILDPYMPGRGYDARREIVPGHPSLVSIPLCLDLSQNEAKTLKSELLANQAQKEATEGESK